MISYLLPMVGSRFMATSHARISQWFLLAALHLAVAASACAQAVSAPSAEAGAAVTVASPGPEAIADTLIQEAIDKVAAAGGGVVLLGPGDFKLSRHAGEETLVLKSGVTLRGHGYATHLYLDPATPPQPARYFPVRIGTDAAPASNVVVENLRYTANNAKIGGGSIMGFNARLGIAEARMLTSDNVTVRHCWIYDAQQAAGCTRDGATAYPTPDRLAAQFKNWQVCHNYIDTCGNKAVEFGECNGGLIADNYITNVKAGPQVIFGTRNVQIRDNEVWFTDTGINISEGSNHIRVSGNHAEPMPTINPGATGGCLFFRTEPQPLHSRVSDVVVTGNIFRDQTTRSRRALRFQTRPEALSCVYEALTITGNVFDGDAAFVEVTNPTHTTIRDIVFVSNICEGDLLSVPYTAMASTHVMIRGNMFRRAGDCKLQANHWIWAGNTHTQSTLEIAAGATGNVVRDNTTAAAIVDQGTKTTLLDNIVISE